MQLKKFMMLAAILLLFVGMAAGSYTANAAEITSTAIVLTQKTSMGGKLFFIIDVQSLRSAYPQAVAVNIFMDVDPSSLITGTSVPLIYGSGSGYNGIPAVYNEYLKLDTSGAGENLLVVSIDLPRENSWWQTVTNRTGINYADPSDASQIRLKIQIDPSTVAVMDGYFTISNNTVYGTYTYEGTQLSLTAFNATWYGGPLTTNEGKASIQLFHGDGTPINLTNGDTAWINYQVGVSNGHETYVLFNANLTDTGIVAGSTTSDMFGGTFVDEYNTSTSYVKLNLTNLGDFSVTPTGTLEAGGVVFPFSEFKQLFNVTLPPISDEKYNSSLTQGTGEDYVRINVTSTSYLNLTLADTNSVFAYGTIGMDGYTGELKYYTYNATADAFGPYTTDFVFNGTHNKEYEVYIVKWESLPNNITVYPSVELIFNDTTIIDSSTPLVDQMNPGDWFEVIGHNLPAGANFTSICLAYWDESSNTFQVWKADVDFAMPQVTPGGTLYVSAFVPEHWYGGKMFYPIIKVNFTGTMYRTWFDAAEGMQIFPYINAWYLEDNGMNVTVNGAVLAPGDYILIKGHGFITTDTLTAFIAYDPTNLSKRITLPESLGLDTDGDGMIDSYIVKNETEGLVSLVVRLPVNINMTLLSASFKFGLAGSGDNVGFSQEIASSVTDDGTVAKVFIWKNEDGYARFKANTTTLDIVSTISDLNVYPYKAYEYISGVKQSEVTVTVEIIGIPKQENGTVTVYMLESAPIEVASFSSTALVQGYKQLTFKVPSTYYGTYMVYINESNDTTVEMLLPSYFSINVSCIVGYMITGGESFTKLDNKALITANPGAEVTFIGFGLDPTADGNITSILPELPSALVEFETTDKGELNVTISTTDLLQLTGRDHGMFQLRLLASPCTIDFTLMISEKPLFKINVVADKNAFVGDTVYVAIKLTLVYATDEVPLLSQPESVAKLEYITLWFIYGSDDKEVVNITDLSSSNVVYVNDKTSEVIVAYTIDHKPATDGLVVDALASAQIFGGYYTSLATDHTVISVDTTLNNKITDAADAANSAATAANAAKSAAEDAASAAQDAANNAADAKSAAENAASAAQNAANAASNAASAAQDAANAAQDAASAAQNAANNAAAAKTAAENAASKVDSAVSSITSSIDDVSKKVETVGDVAGGAKTFGLVNTVLIIITLLVAIFLVVRMKP